MKTLHPFIIKPSLLARGIIALIILFSIGGTALAARVADADENANPTNTPAAPVDPAKQELTPAPEATSLEPRKDTAVPETPDKRVTSPSQPQTTVKTEDVAPKSKEVRTEKLPAASAKKEPDK